MEAYKYLGDKLIKYINSHPDKTNITEIHLRSECPVQLVVNGITENVSDCIINQTELENILYNMCHKSQNVYEDDIGTGFITLRNGERVGISGEYFYSSPSDKYILKKLHSLNIRVPKNNIYFERQDELFSLKPKSTLIVGPPHSGKTSLLKLLCTILCEKYRVAICDERKELYTENINCDVISGIPKAVALSMATRTLNPQFVICDEIGSPKEAQEILSAVNSGVEFICSVHGNDVETVCNKTEIRKLLDCDVFSRIVFVQQNNSRFVIKEIIDV